MTCLPDIKTYYRAAEFERGDAGAKTEIWVA